MVADAIAQPPDPDPISNILNLLGLNFDIQKYLLILFFYIL